MELTLNILNDYLDRGLVVRQSHPTLPLYIWNYSRNTQYEGLWDEVTMVCRGLVTDFEGNIHARPFKKFFNLEESRHNATSEFEVYDKMDGSLIIIFYYDGGWVVASKGSFNSEQSNAASKIFFDKMDNNFSIGITYLFEYTSPNNRIVVDYGPEENLTLIGAIRTNDGVEATYEQLVTISEGANCDVVKRYDGIKDYNKLKDIVESNSEGFVVKFSNGERLKVKGEEYVRLHRIITNISSYDVWEHLKDGKDIESLLDNVPDEFDTWVRDKVKGLGYSYYSVYNYCGKIHDYFRYGKYNDIEVEPTKKEFAMYLMKTIDKEYHGILFSMWDGNNDKVSEIIWNLIKPKYEKPFWQKTEQYDG